MKINPHDPAYPRKTEAVHTPDGTVITREHLGLPIRLELAARFMAASISNQRLVDAAEIIAPKRADISLAIAALDFADALIVSYNEGQE